MYTYLITFNQSKHDILFSYQTGNAFDFNINNQIQIRLNVCIFSLHSLAAKKNQEKSATKLCRSIKLGICCGMSSEVPVKLNHTGTSRLQLPKPNTAFE